MSRTLTLFLITITILSTSLTHYPLSPALNPSLPALTAFSPAACLFEIPAGAIEGTDVQCGYLTVPAEHAVPDGPTIRLAVAVIKSKSSNRQPDPLVMAQGGPGGSTIDTYASLLLTPDTRLRADRDVVLFDQRGTLYSQPKLYCDEYDQLVLDTLEKDLSPEESLRLELQAMGACRERLIEEGVNLSAFDSLENAADIEDLRQALGYNQINLYGVSYGTLLALHYMRQYPDSLRSVILDGVVPPQTNFLLEVAKTEDQSFTHLFTTCANDPACNRAYPDLEKTFFDLVEQFDKTPAIVPLTDPDSSVTYNTVFNGEGFQSTLFQLLYASSMIPALPRMIYDAKRGNFDFMGRIMSIIIFDRTSSYGMYYSVLCAEDADFSPEQQDLAGVRPQIAEIEKRSPGEFLQICKLWDVQPLGSEVDQAVVSDVPTLVLSGAFDPITPPEFAAQVAANLSRSYSFTFPAGGHGQAFEGECSDSMILSFLDDPNTSPDASCIDKISQPEFYTPANLIDVPMISRLLNLEGSVAIEFLILFLALCALLSAVVLLPLAWLVRLLTRKPSALVSPLPPQPAYSVDAVFPTSLDSPLPDILAPQFPSSPTPMPPSSPPRLPFPARIASWLAVGNGLLLLAFLIGFIVVVVQMVTANDTRLYFGVTGLARPWFVLPPLVTLLSLGMLVAIVQAWLRSAWSIWGRLYYTALVISALVCVAILARWGILTALL